MGKKILSILVAVMMLASMATLAVTTASAETEHFSGGTIYWECPWDVAKIAYCYPYGHSGAELAAWGTKDLKMEKAPDKGDNVWKFDVPEGAYDQVIFSIDTGMQTFDLVMTDDNIGDTAYVPDVNNKLENPADSNKTCCVTQWRSGKNGPHLGITSIGNIVGDALCPTESGADMVANFIKGYLPTQPEYVTKEVLDTAMQKANTTGDEVYAVLQADSEFTMLSDAATLLGVSGGDSNNGGDNNASNNGDANNAGDNNADNNGNNGGNNGGNTTTGGNTTGGSRGSSTTSTTSSGTTTTGDTTPYVVLGVVLVAALGIAIVAAKKKVSE